MEPISGALTKEKMLAYLRQGLKLAEADGTPAMLFGYFDPLSNVMHCIASGTNIKLLNNIHAELIKDVIDVSQKIKKTTV